MTVDAVDYKIVELASNNDIVITQDYGLASLLIDKVHTVMHHKGNIYHSNNIKSLLDQRYLNAPNKKTRWSSQGPPPSQQRIDLNSSMLLEKSLIKYRRHIMKRIAVYCGASKGKTHLMLKRHTN